MQERNLLDSGVRLHRARPFARCGAVAYRCPVDVRGLPRWRKIPPNLSAPRGRIQSMLRSMVPRELVEESGRRRRGTENPQVWASGRRASIRLARRASILYPRRLLPGRRPLPADGVDSSRHRETTHRLRMCAVRREHPSVARTVSRLRCVEFAGGSHAAHWRRAHAGPARASGPAGHGVERGPRSGLQGRDWNVGA